VKCDVIFEVRTEFINNYYRRAESSNGHLDTGFLGFPLSTSKCWDGSQIPSCYCMLLMQPSRF